MSQTAVSLLRSRDVCAGYVTFAVTTGATENKNSGIKHTPILNGQ